MKYTSGYKYVLHEDETFLLPAEFAGYAVKTDFIDLRDCKLTLRKGYASDGPSGPTIDTKNSMRGSFAHDGLYQLIREGHLPLAMRPECDMVLYRLIREDGMSWIRARLWLREVRKFGEPAATKPKKILEAP